MALSIADQIALDDALVAPADRLRIGKCNLRLSSDVTSKEATLQVVYDVLKITPFYKAFQVTADAPEIYMQEFWASAYVHNRSVRFKMNNKKHIIGLEQFRDILQICPKVGNKKFVDPPLEKEILIFLASLGHSGDIRKLTDVNVKILRLSQAQILWGMYNKKNVDYAYLLWEDFIFKIETKSTKKGSAMYYPSVSPDSSVQLCVMEKRSFYYEKKQESIGTEYAKDDPIVYQQSMLYSRNEATHLLRGLSCQIKKKANIRLQSLNGSLPAAAQGKEFWNQEIKRPELANIPRGQIDRRADQLALKIKALEDELLSELKQTNNIAEVDLLIPSTNSEDSSTANQTIPQEQL
ncbi:hypothetical protein Tco_0126738 [Tanacetum coccineum]